MKDLSGRTLVITGGSRGIGLAIALRAAQDGANVSLWAKTVDPHPRLEGTLGSAAAAIEAAGGRGLPLQVDIRDEARVQQAADEVAAHFGGIDILVNNASAIFLAGTLDTPMKRFDLMHQVNARGTFACAQACLPHLLASANPHILTLAPPLAIEGRWFGAHLAYTLAKYGMTLVAHGLAHEFEGRLASNTLWPATTIDTAAVRNLLGGADTARHSRKPAIVADAAHEILTRDFRRCSGRFFIDEDVLREAGVTDFDRYASEPGADLYPDFFL